MVGTVRLAYAVAYAIKKECGGGYRGVVQNMLTNEIKRGERRDTIAEARTDAKRFVFEFANGRNMTTGTYNTRSRESWKCSYFIRDDEVNC